MASCLLARGSRFFLAYLTKNRNGLFCSTSNSKKLGLFRLGGRSFLKVGRADLDLHSAHLVRDFNEIGCYGEYEPPDIYAMLL